MKTSIKAALFFVVAFIAFSGYTYSEDKSVDIIDLVGKDFKYIVQINNTMSAEEIESAEEFLKQYNSKISLDYSQNSSSGIKSLSISGEGVNCKSDDFGSGIILVTKDNKCQCGIGDAKYMK